MELVAPTPAALTVEELICTAADEAEGSDAES